MRINLHWDIVSSGYSIPLYVRTLIDDAVKAFCKEYQISLQTGHKFLCTRERISHLIPVLTTYGVRCESYDADPIPSWGLIIPDDDEMLVEYKLKYGE